MLCVPRPLEQAYSHATSRLPLADDSGRRQPRLCLKTVHGSASSTATTQLEHGALSERIRARRQTDRPLRWYSGFHHVWHPPWSRQRLVTWRPHPHPLAAHACLKNYISSVCGRAPARPASRNTSIQLLAPDWPPTTAETQNEHRLVRCRPNANAGR